MAAMVPSVVIAALLNKAHGPITEQTGLPSWWTKDSIAFVT